METGNTNTQLQPTVSDYSSIQRKKWVMDQYLMGRYPYEIRAEYKELYRLSDASYDKDVTWTNTELEKQGQYQVEEIIKRHSERYDFVYRASIEAGDRRSALQALKSLEDLYRLHKDKSNTVGSVTLTQTNNLNLPPMSVNEIRELLGKGSIIDIPSASNTEDYSV